MTEKWNGLAEWIATCGGVGYIPKAPGTAGAALGMLLVVVTGRLPLTRLGLIVLLAFVLVLVFFLGVWATGRHERTLHCNDPASAVIDEFVGQLVVFLYQPAVSWKWLLAGFVAFRIFDIVKPFPIHHAEKIAGGWGIMLDDVAAGAYGCAVLWLLRFAFGQN